VSNEAAAVATTASSWFTTDNIARSPSRTCSSVHEVTSSADNIAAVDCNACHGSDPPSVEHMSQC
jgi:hypothetical protein